MPGINDLFMPAVWVLTANRAGGRRSYRLKQDFTMGEFQKPAEIRGMFRLSR
jgi:hypothetical protein